jgi:hypothetical protein
MKHLIFLILLSILFYIQKYYETFLINEDKWLDYRLGDIVCNYFRDKKQYNYLKKIEKRLPNSIGGLYIKNTQNLDRSKQSYNYDLLNGIINGIINKKKINLPEKDDIVIHIRLGDIIKGETKDNIKFQSNHWYGTNIGKLEEQIKGIKNLKKVYIVYGSHTKNINIGLNNKYLDNITKMLEKNSIKPILRNRNPDDDFIFMAKSKKFIRSGGGFSNVISNLVKKNGGVVYVPK